MLNKIELLNVGITNETEDKILEYLYISLKKRREKYYIVTPNPEILVFASTHPEYKLVLNNARIALPDGVGVFLGSFLLGNRLKERIAGVDFMEEVCKRSFDNPITVGFLGGRRGVAERTSECLKRKYPWINVAFIGENWTSKVKDDLQSKNIDILFVAFGFPKQEEWIYENLDSLPVRVAMGVGGAFDYIGGEVMRAPFMIRAIGLEWLFRLVRQPWRFKRQAALFKFIKLLCIERKKKLVE